jgi:cardiolipin synthase
MRSAVLFLTIALAAGCATLPDVHPWSRASDAHKAPTLVGSRGQLTPERSARLLERLQAKGGGSDLFIRHLAVEEEVAGRPLTVGNQATLLVDGPRSYRSMFEAIERARDSINIEFYIIEDDDVGRRFADALLKKRAQGVAVNLMYDSVGCNNTPREFFDRLRAGGVNVLEYNPVNPLRARGAWRLNNRDHRKLVVVDGEVAFTGGINISEVYSSGSSPGSGSRRGSIMGSGGALSRGSGSARQSIGWRDTNVRVEGPAVEQLQKLFLETWEKQGGAALETRNWFPSGKRQGSHPVRIIASGPGDEVPAIYVALLNAIAYAEKSVHITMAYFVPDPQTIRALKDAAARGVDVKLVLPSYTDFWAVFHAGRSHYADLLGARSERGRPRRSRAVGAASDRRAGEGDRGKVLGVLALARYARKGHGK